MNVPNYGAFVDGSPFSTRKVTKWRLWLDMHADLDEQHIDPTREGYLSHFAFGEDFLAHIRTHKGSVAGFDGACWTRFLVFDIDSPNLESALVDARRLATHLGNLYPPLDGRLPIYFSGRKGFHLYLELVHEPEPSTTFHDVCRTLAERIADGVGVKIDTSIYSKTRILRLPNSRHPKTGLHKRRIVGEDILRITVPQILERAREPAGDGFPTCSEAIPALAEHWADAERNYKLNLSHRQTIREVAKTQLGNAPKYLMDFLRFKCEPGERARTLFRCAAWITEAWRAGFTQGSPCELVHALLTEAGLDNGLSPGETKRQIDCGIKHAITQSEGGAEG